VPTGSLENVEIIVIDVKGLMLSLMSYYNITIHATFPICVCVCVCLQVYYKMGAYEKVKSEMVVSNPRVWVFSHGIWKSKIKKGN
jgi:hypothetical protein